MADYSDLPNYDSLPPVEGMPKGCAWGVFDKNGVKDHLGCLNLLTPSVVKEAYSTLRDGVSISLNSPMDLIKLPTGRAATIHKILTWKDDMHASWNSLDDEVSFNTQCSSQWDSFLHFPHQATGFSYNGNKAGKEQLMKNALDYAKEKRADGKEGKIPSLDHWHEFGGLVGRGVLLDYRAYAKAKGIEYQTLTRHVITIADLEAIAAHQGTTLKQGDILIVRTGIVEDVQQLDADGQLQAMMKGGGGMIGVEGTEEAAKWFWNKHFAAVAGDSLSFEVYPPAKPDGTLGDSNDLVLHQYFLGLFGLNIGELWNLQALGEYCAKVGRYDFVLTSIPLNIPGLVGSPPNAMALF